MAEKAPSEQKQVEGSPTISYSVRIPRASDPLKKHSILKFNEGSRVEFSNTVPAKLERENNYKEFKLANDVEMMPKTGAGSEYGKEQRELARRKKFGMRIRKYNVQDQPLLLKMGTGKQARKFKGVRDGGVLGNASYWILTQSTSDAKVFEAYPIEDWYHFTPQARYKCLNAEEAEEEFNKRDKTLNYFSIMLKKRIKQGEGEEDLDDKKEQTKKSKAKDKSLTLTEFDEWIDDSDEENSDGPANDSDSEKKPNKKEKNSARNKKKKKEEDEEEEEEPMEESDDEDEGKEKDYSSGDSSEFEDMYDEKGYDNEDKYGEHGVEDEDGLKKLVNTDDEDEEDEKKDENGDDLNDDDDNAKDNKVGNSESSSSSDSESDIDQAADIFLQGQDKKDRFGVGGGRSQSSNSRPSTPSDSQSGAHKRKNNSSPVPAKKPKLQQSTTAALNSNNPAASSNGASTSSTSSPPSSDSGIEEDIRRYLLRKPMTTQDLLRKLKPRLPAYSKDKIVQEVAAIIKKIKPEQTMIKDKKYFSLSKNSS